MVSGFWFIGRDDITITRGGVPLLVVDSSKISQQVTPLSFSCHTPEVIIAPILYRLTGMALEIAISSLI